MLFGVTAKTPDGKIMSYRFEAQGHQMAKVRAQQLCDEAQYEFIRVTRMGFAVNVKDQWTQ